MSRIMPDIINEVGFDFSWDERKVWELDLPEEEMAISELVWHFDVPFIWSQPDGYYDVLPREVIQHPDQYPDDYRRIMLADIVHPIDIMFWKNRWLILDGLHRLMKQAALGRDIVLVRKVPESAIALIRK
jgi:hypothetical protein